MTLKWRAIRTVTLTALTSVFFAFGATGAMAEEEKKGPPFGERKKAPPPKPAERQWTVTQEGERKFAFSFNFKPGIPDPDQLTEIMVNINEIPKRAHPTFGSSIPMQKARVELDLLSPGDEVVGRYLAHAIPLSRGTYGLHMTPAQDGVYTINLRGKLEDGTEVKASVKLPVNVWPLPKELQGAGTKTKTTSRRRPIKL
jgi:hypothetical protein